MKRKNSEKKGSVRGCSILFMFVLIGFVFYVVNEISRPAPRSSPAPTAEAVTMIPQATGEAVMSNLDLIKTTLTMAQTPPILDVVVNDDIKRVQIVFTSGNTLAEIEQQMQTVFCAAAPVIPAGYDMRLGAKASNSITLATAVINANKMRPDSCVGNINWATFADEYNPASGLVAAPTVARAAPQQQRRRPDNCEEARAMGLSEREAAQWDHLDRDNDGVACYGD